VNDKQDLISVIIPMYNAKESVERCVESVRKSTYTNLEIILVDDGSTDETLEICMKMMDEDRRIKVIAKKNSGAGFSRECGVGAAKGKYIGFVDADDYIENTMYEKLYDRIVKDKLDVCFCGNYEIFSDGKKVEKNIRFPYELYTQDCIQRDVIKNAVWFTSENSKENPMFSIWRGLYAIDVIKNNKIHFLDERIVGSEDGIFNFQVLCNTKRLGFIHECLYNYGIYQNSLTNDYSRWDSKDDLRSNNWYSCIENYAKEKHVEKYVIPYLNAEYLCKVRKSINTLIYENNTHFKKMYKNEKEKYIFIKKINVLRTKGNGIRNKIDFILCLHFIKIYRYKILKRK
jgi:hypothetical protein